MANDNRPIWVVLLFGLALACVIVAGIFCVVTTQTIAQIALAPTATLTETATRLPTSTATASAAPTSTPTSTSTSTRTPIPTKIGTATRTALARGTPTQTTLPRGTPTGTLSPRGTATPTPIRISQPLATNLTFRFDAGVPSSEREFFQKAMGLAQFYLGDVGPVTFFAYANLDNLADDVDKFYGRSATSQASRNFREMFSTDNWIAASGPGTISVWVSAQWNENPSTFKLKALVHEYFHLVQWSSTQKNLDVTGPIWLSEGAAEVAADTVVVKEGIYTWESVHGDKITQSRGMLSPLSSMITLQDTEIEDTAFPYTIGFLATEYLLTPFGNSRIEGLKKFYQAQSAGATWQDAFKTTFGLSVDEFYPKFEQYRAANYPPLCGRVGASLAQATPAPLGVRFVQRLAPGAMPLLEASWVDAPNIPYVFCATGVKLPTLPSSIYEFPRGIAGWAACGANCLVLYVRPDTRPGRYTFAINLPDGKRAEANFDVQ